MSPHFFAARQDRDVGELPGVEYAERLSAQVAAAVAAGEISEVGRLLSSALGDGHAKLVDRLLAEHRLVFVGCCIASAQVQGFEREAPPRPRS
jgi:hypothetical protein